MARWAELVRDMTRGRPIGRMLSFCAPLLIGNLFQQFYNMADSIIVGRYLGVNAFAAVGSTGSVNFLIIGFVLGACSGFSIPVAQDFGAGDMRGVRRSAFGAAVLALVIAAVLTVLTLMGTRPIMRLLRTPEDIFEDACSYIFVIFAGTGATVLYNLLSGVLRALGDSRTPLYFLAAACLINIGLDIFFIVAVGMGVAGAALATVISQAVSGLLCLVYIAKKFPILHLTREDMRLDRTACLRALKSGVPMGLQFSITAVGSTILQSAVNQLGSGPVAAMSACGKIQNILSAPMDTMGITIATYCGQNYGAGKIDRLKKGVLQAALATLLYSVAALAIAHFGARTLALLFIDQSQSGILDYISQFMNANALAYPLLVMIFILRNALQGMGYSSSAMFAGLFELVGRTFVAFCLVTTLGFAGVCLANPCAWFMANALLIPLYTVKIRALSRHYQARERLSQGS